LWAYLTSNCIIDALKKSPSSFISYHSSSATLASTVPTTVVASSSSSSSESYTTNDEDGEFDSAVDETSNIDIKHIESHKSHKHATRRPVLRCIIGQDPIHYGNDVHAAMAILEYEWEWLDSEQIVSQSLTPMQCLKWLTGADIYMILCHLTYVCKLPTWSPSAIWDALEMLSKCGCTGDPDGPMLFDPSFTQVKFYKCHLKTNVYLQLT
jgi:hypothetical protein